MNRTWNFTDIEFFVLCESMKEDTLPPPLVFTSRTLLHDDFLREKTETRNSLRTKVDRHFDEVLTALFHPDIRIVVDGWGGQNSDDPKACVRMFAVRQGDRGYVVKQLPGETIWHSGGFAVTECDAIALANAVSSGLPTVEAGKLPDVVLTTEDRGDGMDYAYGQSAIEDSFDDSVALRSERFLEAPATTIGTIEVIQGSSRFGPRGIVRREIGWRDVVDDGRYAITPGIPSVAVGADAARLRTMINTEIAAVIRVIKDERV